MPLDCFQWLITELHQSKYSGKREEVEKDRSHVVELQHIYSVPEEIIYDSVICLVFNNSTCLLH